MTDSLTWAMAQLADPNAQFERCNIHGRVPLFHSCAYFTNPEYEQAHEEVQSGGGGADMSGIQYADVLLTDAQIKALPVTPAILVSARGVGSGEALLPWKVYARLNWVANYGGYSAIAQLQIAPNALLGVTEGDSELTSFFANDEDGLLILSVRDSTTYNIHNSFLETQAITMSLSPGSALTGGHPSSTMSVRVWYSVVPAVEF